MPDFPEHAQLANISLIEDLYRKYKEDPTSVDDSWRHFFEGIDFGTYLFKRGEEGKGASCDARIYDLIAAYRCYGHLLAHFNPLEIGEKKAYELELQTLGFFESELEQMFPCFGFCGKEQATLKEIIDSLKGIYCNRIGFEYLNLGNPDLEKWIQSRIEPKLTIEPSIEEKHLLLEYLNKAESFETFLHTKYVGQTRFSLEGAETMIPLLAEMIDLGGNLGIEEFLIGMAHRGRLNVLTNILNKPYAALLKEFEDDLSLSFAGNDDVKYHMGFTGEWKTRSGNRVVVHLAANPSHLESVDPVVLGEVYAKQILKKDEQKSRVIPILIHGDASLAGQGVVYETLQLMNLPNYSVGGTIHLVVNNQIGYTTLPEQGRSTRYCTDVSKTFSSPVFHVNAEDPESCLFAAKLAVEIRQKFHCDVFIDLLCYRKYGHNEGDEPSFTQPLEYKMIRNKKGIRQLYYEDLLSSGRLEKQMAEALEIQFKQTLQEALEKAQEKIVSSESEHSKSALKLLESCPTGVGEKDLRAVIEAYCTVPESFHLHPKLQKSLQDRLQAVSPKGVIDWATGETLGFGSLLMQGISLRLAGQDSQRGTFSQRHLVWIDSETGISYCSLAQLKEGRLEVVNSPLSEFAGMGFEYGYSLGAPKHLAIWEAQYGDFDNGAQIIIDQYVVCGEQKWNCPSSLTLLLPHGYEGAGPEHSSARIERFLQLAADDNIQVVNPTTPAQYFHLIRRQALRKAKKPLIVFAPKSLLRLPACTSRIHEFSSGQFEELLDDPTPPQKCKRVLICTGKVFYDLILARKQSDVAILRLEQMYPFHTEKLKKLLEKYKGFTECVWVQEEPENMGAWSFVAPYLQNVLPKEVNISYVGRPKNATTATGSHKKHKQEQQTLINQALGG